MTVETKRGPLTVRISDQNRHGPWGYSLVLFGEVVSADCGYKTRELAESWAAHACEAWAEYFTNLAGDIK